MTKISTADDYESIGSHSFPTRECCPVVMHIHGGRVACGVATHIFTFLKHINTSRFKPILVLLRPGIVSDMARNSGIDHLILNAREGIDPLAILRLRTIIKNNNVKIIHTHTINGNFYGSLASFLMPGVTLITTVHTFLNLAVADHYKSKSKRAFILAQNRFLRRKAKKIIATSEGVAEMLADEGIPSRRIELIRNGIPALSKKRTLLPRQEVRQSWKIEHGHVLIGACGRMVPQKNFHLLLELVERLPHDKDRVRLAIIGDGPEMPRLKELAVEKGINDQVLFLGWQSEAWRMMSAFDIYVLPSLEENFTYSILEAMLAGCPVVAFATGAIPEIVVDEVTGYVCHPQSVGELCAAVERLVKSKYVKREMSIAAENRVSREFSLDKMVTAMERIYSDIAN